MSVDYYALLGIPKFCNSQDEIRRAYLAQARFFHPDAGNVSPEIAHLKMQQLNTIYETLKDPNRKKLYDASLVPTAKPKAAHSYSASYAPPSHTQHHTARTHSKFMQTVIPPLIITAALFACFTLVGVSSKADQTSFPTKTVYEPIAPSTFSAQTPVLPIPTMKPLTMMALPIPASGEILYHNQQECIAPFIIETSGSGYYVVKLKDHVSGVDVLCVFIHAGDTIDVDVPLGDFDLYYASGDVWYGMEHLFGDATVCSKATDLFDFSKTGEYVSGWTVTLYPVYNGNMQTVSIDIDKF